MRTDLGMLKALEAVKEKLASTTSTAFRRMREDLEGGKVVGLSIKQRKWVEQIYLEHDLDKREGKPRPAPPKAKKVASGELPTVWPWERTDDKPLKPPPRR